MQPTAIQVASGLLGIHHHDKRGNVIYKEQELLELLSKWGHPAPDWDGAARENHAFAEMLQRVHQISPPGATLRKTMKERGMTEKELSENLGITEDLLQDLFNGYLRIKGFAERLEEIFGLDRIVWINLQRSYDKEMAIAGK